VLQTLQPHYEEIKIIDPNIEQIISKEEYERFIL